jgi:outer membrane protein assembly factor BamB
MFISILRSGARRAVLIGSAVLCLAILLLAWAGMAAVNAQPPDEPKDPNVQPGGSRFQDNPRVLSAPILRKPLYACADTVVVRGYVPGARIKVYIGGAPPAVGGGDGKVVRPEGDPFPVSNPFTAGQVVTVTQTVDGVESGPSNSVTVRNYREDYPDGMPQPRLGTPCLDCGRAVGVADVIPGATYRVFAQDPTGPGTFGPAVEVGSNKDFPYTFVAPPFKRGQRITAQAFMCADPSPVSEAATVDAEPLPIPEPVVDPVFGPADRVLVRGPGDSGVLHGAQVEVVADDTLPPNERVGGQPSPGGAQQVFIAPNANGGNYRARQSLCTAGALGPPTRAQPCSSVPPPKIRPPMPGDNIIDLTEFNPGSRIHVTVGTEELGDGSGPQLTLNRRLEEGETVTVVQSIGPQCTGDLVYVLPVGCRGRDRNQCSAEWPAFRHSGLRDGNQPINSVLADPDRVRTLGERWRFTPEDPGEFRASPIVHRGRVYVGNGNGRLYALDAATGGQLWQYPPKEESPLVSDYTCNASSHGLAASATIATINGRDVVIFGGPDKSIGSGHGSGRVFALDAASGAVLWKSPEAAILNGINPSDTSEKHEQFGYSAPLVLNERVYLGIANHCDNPIQNGHLAVLDVNSGMPVSGFSYLSTSTRGGGIWSHVAGGLDPDAVVITTGNTQCWNGGAEGRACQTEPVVNHGLSMLRLNAATGAIDWKLQPVPFALDGDPDWASGAALMATRCGHVAASTQKDGWAYAARSDSSGGGGPGMRWQFPATGFPFTSGAHGDTRYQIAGGGWQDTFITMAGGFPVEAGNIGPGFTRLHGLDTCGPPTNPVRWLLDVPGTVPGATYQMGPPSVTRGIMFVGTAQGHLVAFADPSVWSAAGSVCSNPEVSNADCAAHGFSLVPRPMVLANIDLGAGGILTEPVLARGRVFVATGGGTVVMLAPK